MCNWFGRCVHNGSTRMSTFSRHTTNFFIRRKIHTAKFPYSEISVRRKFLRRNILTANFPYGEISLRRNFLTAKYPTAKYPTATYLTVQFDCLYWAWEKKNTLWTKLCVFGVDYVYFIAQKHRCQAMLQAPTLYCCSLLFENGTSVL